jgi:hypothetical protein
MIFDLDLIEHINYRDDYIRLPVPRRYIRDADNPLVYYNYNEFRRRYRFYKEIVLNIIMPLVFANDPLNQRGLPVPPIIKITTALRFYATGSFQLVCGDLSKISQSSVCHIINRTSEQLSKHIGQVIKCPRTQAQLDANRQFFYQIAGFRGVAGVIDGTHIPIQSPGGPRAEIYRNRKTYFSLNVQIVGGPQLEILDIVVRWPGSTHDSRIFENSSVKLQFQRRQIPGLLLGDSGYPQTNYLYTPVLNPVNEAQEIYNNALKGTRQIIEGINGKLKRRFPCLHVKLQYKIGNILRIITACAVLHNLGIMHGDLWLEEEEGDPPALQIQDPPLPENLMGNAIKLPS